MGPAKAEQATMQAAHVVGRRQLSQQRPRQTAYIYCQISILLVAVMKGKRETHRGNAPLLQSGGSSALVGYRNGMSDRGQSGSEESGETHFARCKIL